jgi:hypothetical protein
LLWFSVLLVGQPLHAGVFDVPPKNYYGPLQRLHGVGFTNGVTKDGYLKIYAEARRIDGDDFALDSALYRAAEMARVGGYRYVEMHDGYSQRSRVGESATVFALPTNTAAHPIRCRSGKPKRCYTADVASVLKTLSGTTGMQPGVAASDHLDQYGRSVTYSGFGIGSINN